MLVGAAIGAAGSILGGLAASKAMKKARQGIERQMRDNQNWYDRRYNEDATQRADAQRLLTATAESIRRRNRGAAGRAAVAGGTEESVAAEKAANASALANATSGIAAQAEARKDAIENQYMAQKQNLQGQLNNLEMQKAQNIGQAIRGVANAAGQMDLGGEDAAGADGGAAEMPKPDIEGIKQATSRIKLG